MRSLFCIIDVLGFKSFCENCEFSGAEKILEMMDQFEDRFPEELWKTIDVFGTIPDDKKKKARDKLNWLTFSDTIFVALPIDPSDHPDELKFNLLLFTTVVAGMNRRMFEIGLPVRGAVHIGDILMSKRCFAGKAVMVALRLGEKSKAAVTVVSDDAHAFICESFAKPEGLHFMYRDRIVECDIPVGEAKISESVIVNTSEKMKTVSWFKLELGKSGAFDIPSDLGAYVRAKFTAHGKKLGEKEKMKAFNTEQIFRSWQAASPGVSHGQVLIRA